MAGKRKHKILALLLSLTMALSFSVMTSADEDTDSENTDTEFTQDESSENEYENDNDENTSDEGSADESFDEENFDPDENSRQRQELKDENSELKDKIKLTEQEIKDKEKRSKQLQEQISTLSVGIKDSNDKIKTLNAEITDKQTQIEGKSAEIEDVLALLRVRLRNIHTSGDTTSLEIILGAKSFSDFIDKSELIKSMSEYDSSLIHSIEEQAEIIAIEQKALRQKKADVETEKELLEKNKETINTLFEENTKLISELKASKKNLQDEQKENESKQAELKKALEEYRKRQAEKDKVQIIAAPESEGKYVWPCPGFTYLTSTFDEWRGANNHGALDIAEAGIYGAKVIACYDGIVFSTYEYCEHDYGKFESCGCGGGYGNYVMIDHGSGKISVYGHLSGVTVTPGQSVAAGQLIGYVGSTGYSTGAHLHFETRYNNVRYDPLSEY